MPTPADVLLSDGTIAVIRQLLATDRPELDRLHEEVSDASFRLRFFASGRSVGHTYVEHLFSGTGAEICLVALVRDRIVAVATAERLDDDSAEVAFLVDDAYRGHGVGILLLEHLAAAGRDRGISRFTAEVLSENVAMARVFRAAGFQVERVTSQGVTDVEMSTVASARAVAAADARESVSEARSLAALTRPRRVAVVGASRHGDGIGNAVLASIADDGFTGEVVVVHPDAAVLAEVTGLPSYARLVDVPGHVDVVVVAVPAAGVLDVLHDAVAAGASLMVILSSGFSEVGPSGADLQRELVRVARLHGIRLVGPNCLGLLVNDPDVRLNATFSRLVPGHGGLAVASQSGGVGVALLDVAMRTGLGIHTFVSLGNKGDVSGNDLLSAWLEDPTVTAAALYLESFGNAPKFARLARRFSERKPLLVVLGGRSAGGRRAGASHTAAAATSTVAVEALVGHSGVIACRSAEELAETALVLSGQPLPAGRRVAVVTNAGGMGVLAADAADAAGLVVPRFSDALQARLQVAAPGVAGPGNPVDVGAGATAATVRATFDEVLASDEVDALVVVLVATRVADPAPLEQALAEARAARPLVPVLLVTIGSAGPDRVSPQGVTVLPSATTAVEALARVSRYAAWLGVPRETPSPTLEPRARAARRLASEDVSTAEVDSVWLPPGRAAALLSPYGLEPVGEVARGAAAAVAAARRVGFPVALKVADPDVVHKTDRGLVRTGLASPGAVTAAVEAFATELGTTAVEVLVQPMVAGVEMALGLVRDPTFGPLVMVAAGGTAIDLWQDRVFLLPPLDPGTVSRAIRSLRSWPLLDGFRGSERVDVAALERLVLALGELGSDVPQIAELDLNPVMVDVDGARLVDVKVRLSRATGVDPGVPRRLRSPR